ncbi:MAG: hypothetical protein ACYTEL_13615 [Planctomycetota bacterium]
MEQKKGFAHLVKQLRWKMQRTSNWLWDAGVPGVESPRRRYGFCLRSYRQTVMINIVRKELAF